MAQLLNKICVGNQTTGPETTSWADGPGGRTLEQYQAALQWFADNPAAWLCGSGHFDPDCRPCSFVVAYFSTGGALQLIRISPTGRITKKILDTEPIAQKQAAEVVALYGAFSGGAQ